MKGKPRILKDKMRCPKCGCDVFSAECTFTPVAGEVQVIISAILETNPLEVDRRVKGEMRLDGYELKCWRCLEKVDLSKIDDKLIPDDLYKKLESLIKNGRGLVQ